MAVNSTAITQASSGSDHPPPASPSVSKHEQSVYQSHLRHQALRAPSDRVISVVHGESTASPSLSLSRTLILPCIPRITKVRMLGEKDIVVERVYYAPPMISER